MALDLSDPITLKVTYLDDKFGIGLAEQSRQTHKVPGLVVGILNKGKIKAAGCVLPHPQKTNMSHK